MIPVIRFRGLYYFQVKAVALTGELTPSEMDQVFMDFDRFEPNVFAGRGSGGRKEKFPTIRLLYFTPEKVNTVNSRVCPPSYIAPSYIAPKIDCK